MSARRTTYELNLGGTKIAQWIDDDRKIPPAKHFVTIPRLILERPELASYSIRAAVISRLEVEGGFLVQVEAIRLD